MRSVRAPTFIEQARRRQILAAAIELLADGGYRAASLAAIAAHIGVSKGVISYHFDTKDDLLAQVVISVLTDAGDFMRTQVEGASDASEMLRRYIGSNLTYLSTHRTEIRALTTVLAGMPPAPDGEPGYAAAAQQAIEALAALLAAGQRTGEFRTFDVRVAARSLRASIDSVTDLLRVEPTLDVDAYAYQLLGLFEAAVRS